MIKGQRTLIKDVVSGLITSIIITSIVALGIIYYSTTRHSQESFNKKGREYISYLKESLALSPFGILIPWVLKK